MVFIGKAIKVSTWFSGGVVNPGTKVFFNHAMPPPGGYFNQPFKLFLIAYI